jgi:hypothetical protein
MKLGILFVNAFIIHCLRGIMFDTESSHRSSDTKEFLRILRHEIQQAQRPANEIILDDEDVMRILKISKRKLQYLKAGLIIPHHRPDEGTRTYYLLSDILGWLNKSRIESISNNLKTKFK